MTDTTRDLIQRMATELDLYRQLVLDDCTSTHRFADEARAYLAQPEPEGPTDEELWELYDQRSGEPEDWPWIRDYARAVLARWGRPELEGPTVMEIIELANEIEAEGLGQVDLVRRALARWGSALPTPQP